MEGELLKSPRSKDMDAEHVKDVDAGLVKSPRSQPGQYFSPLKSIIDVF